MQCAVERELVLRLASLPWRLRRATTMEPGLFETQADHLNRNHAGTASSTCVPRSCVCAVRGGDDLSSLNGDPGFARQHERNRSVRPSNANLWEFSRTIDDLVCYSSAFFCYSILLMVRDRKNDLGGGAPSVRTYGGPGCVSLQPTVLLRSIQNRRAGRIMQAGV
jgi:hypothetical protein